MKKQLDPVLTGITVALSSATAAGTLFSTLGIAAASVVITGAASLGIFAGAWIWYKRKKMDQVLEANGLTPSKAPYPCGLEAKKQTIIDKQFVNE